MNYITVNMRLLKKVLLIIVLAGILPIAHIAVKSDRTAETVPVKAKVLEITDKRTDTVDLGNGALYVNEDIEFSAAITSGNLRGERVEVLQNRNNYVFDTFKEVSAGNKVLIANSGEGWYLIDYVRLDGLIVLGAVFALGIIILGRLKGLYTLISLVLTICAVFMVFVPAVLGGGNIYLWSVMVCVYVTVMTLLLVSEPHKSLAAGCGCLGGLLVTAVLVLIMDKALMLTGMVDENAHYLTYMENPIDLNAVIFASIIIGALGAIMDVAMSIASAMWEVSLQAKEPDFKSLVQSGLAVGKDVMGTMANTLVLAYMGSSFSVVLLIVSYSASLNEILNRELIIVEILNALAGSMGILVTIPITAFIASLLYAGRGNSEKLEEEFDEEKAIEEFWSK